MYHSILVPLDGSPFGEQALPWAVSLARRAGAALHLVSVHVPVTPVIEKGLASFDRRLDLAERRRRQAYLESVVGRVVGATELPVLVRVVEGLIGDALCEEAAATGADLVVMTTHGRGGLARAWLGSVADDLIRRLTVPILLARPQEAAPVPAQEPSLRHMLIPLDGSELAERILEPTVALGSLTEAEYTLLQVIPPLVIGSHPIQPESIPGVEYPVVKEVRALHDQERRTADDYLAQVAERLRRQSLRVHTRRLENDQPAPAILAEAKGFPDGLIALETHGRGGVARLLLGSVTDKVVRAATLPVLVHRSLRP